MGNQIAISSGGVMRYWEEGEKVFFRVEFPGGVGAQYKIWLVGKGGNEMLLGTAGFQGEGLRLFRTVSRIQLQYSGCWPVQEVRVRKIPVQMNGVGEWYCEEYPEKLVFKSINGSMKLGAMLCRKDVRGFELAIPFCDHKPIALNSFFCFANLKILNGKKYLIWRFDPEGRPKILEDLKMNQ